MSIPFDELTRSHPCFSTGAKLNKGRIHLSVYSGCNIRCNFCDRALNNIDLRPVVASMIITSDEALDVIRKAVVLCPDITVAGVLGGVDIAGELYIHPVRLENTFSHG